MLKITLYIASLFFLIGSYIHAMDRSLEAIAPNSQTAVSPIELFKSCRQTQEDYLANTQLFEALAAHYKLPATESPLMMRLLCLASFITDLSVPKAEKISYVNYGLYQGGLSDLAFRRCHLNEINRSETLSPEKSEFEKIERPLLKRFKKLLEQDNVLNIEHSHVKYRLYKYYPRIGDPAYLTLKPETICATLTDIPYEMPLLAFAIHWQSTEFVQALHLTGISLNISYVYFDQIAVGQQAHECLPEFFDKEMTSIAHAAAKFNERLLRAVLAGSKNLNAHQTEPAASEMSSPMHEVIHSFSLNRHHSQIEECKKLLLLLREHGFSLNDLAHKGRGGDSIVSVLDAFIHDFHSFLFSLEEDKRPYIAFIEWLREQGAQVTAFTKHKALRNLKSN